MLRRVSIAENTTLSSCAPVGSVFLFAGMVRGPKHTRLSNAHLEQLILLKSTGYATEN